MGKKWKNLKTNIASYLPVLYGEIMDEVPPSPSNTTKNLIWSTFKKIDIYRTGIQNQCHKRMHV